jgi:hypothetical protein
MTARPPKLLTAGYEKWTDGAVCANVDPELFFPAAGDNASLYRAKALCATCPVIAECLAYAVANHVEGIWGGTSTRTRSAMRGPRAHQPQPIAHGSEAGARVHRRRGEAACESCKQAELRTRRDRYQRQREAA